MRSVASQTCARIVGRLGFSIIVVAAVAFAPILGQPGSGRAHTTTPDFPALLPVVITTPVDGIAAAADAVGRAGGVVSLRYPALSALAATVPAKALDQLKQETSVSAVLPQLAEGPTSADATASADGPTDVSFLPASLRASLPASSTGAGVDVAVLDTGIDRAAAIPIAAGAAVGHVTEGTDVSLDNSDLGSAHRDGFGHGTAMAGIVSGLAPQARLVDVKAAGAEGTTSPQQMLAAMDWVVAHRHSDGLDIRVLNLSFGVEAATDPTQDVLAYAAEVAWRQGIVVVASAGNGGATSPVTSPATSPTVLAIGAVDARDRVAAFTSGERVAGRKADLFAPGTHVVSSRVPGSTLDSDYPAARVAGAEGGSYFRGSGTSQAAATVTGAAALLLQARPELTPDQVKSTLVRSAATLPDGTKVLRLRQALALGHQDSFKTGVGGAVGASELTSSASLRTVGGSLSSRGVLSSIGEAMTRTPAPVPVPVTATAPVWAGRSWGGRSWGGLSWGSETWGGRSWGSETWDGRSWGGRAWGGRSWGSASWDNAG